MLDVCLLGTGGMMPLPNRFLTSLLLRHNGKMLLIDCGEGTQVTMKSQGWGFKSLELICITHFHADHVAGLPGLLLAIANSGREEPLTIIGPRGLKRVVSSLLIIAGEIPFDINFVESDGGETFDFEGYTVKTVLGEHRINVLSYRVDIRRKGKFDVEKAEANNIPMHIWSKLQKEGEAVLNGIKYTASMVLGSERKGISVTYCTDTRPKYEIVDLARKSDLFICEGMYGDDDKLLKAMEYKHMLFSEAANMAALAEVSELWLTHFSPSIPNPSEYLKFASDIFENTIIGTDRMTKTLVFED